MSGVESRGFGSPRVASMLSAVVAAGVVVQAFLAMAYFQGAGESPLSLHRMLGGIVIVAAVGAGVSGFLAHRGVRPGLVGHSLSLPILAILLGAVSRADGWLGGVHSACAVLLAIAAASLVMINARIAPGDGGSSNTA